MVIRFTVYLILCLVFVSNNNSTIIFNECNPNCICDHKDSNLTIRCYSELTETFKLPNLVSNLTLISVKDSFLTNYPSNICIFSNALSTLDLSDNQITDYLNSSYFDCLKKLEYLYLSNNSISYINENSFNELNYLKELDLSYNQITHIPINLFYFKLPNLTYLNLKHNRLKEIDVWILFLRSIKLIDLSYNHISTFVNQIGWNFYFVSPNLGLGNAELIDLRFNKLTRFDDELLRLFSVCTHNDFKEFLNLFNKLLIDNNDLTCDCKSSYNLLKFYQTYITKNTITSSNYLFFHKCYSPVEYFDKNIFSFIDPNTCSNISEQFSFNNCGYGTTTTTTTTTQSFNIEKLIENEKIELNRSNVDYFNDSQIAGYIIGILGIFILLLLLIFFICSIEILAVCFNCLPIFYSVCPCKSGVKREKEYDLFISFNKVNENWIHKKLIPFIKENYLIENFILHYNYVNKRDDVFNDYVKSIMNKSSCILFVLSDAFLMKEWNDQRFREHLRYLITKENIRFITVQMHDVCDEEIEEYFINKLQIPRFVSLENDEFLFWKKLAYFLYTNKTESSNQYFKQNKIHDGSFNKPSFNNPKQFSSALFSKYGTPDPYSSSTSLDLPSISTFNEESAIYSSSKFLTKKKDINMHKKIIMNKTSKNILLNTNERKPILTHDSLRHEITSDESFNLFKTNDSSLIKTSQSKPKIKSFEKDYMNNLIYQQKISSKNGRYPNFRKNSFRSTSDSDNNQ